MTSRELLIKTLNHEPVDRVARDLSYAPDVETSRADEVAEIELRYPKDIVAPDFKSPSGKRSKGRPFRVGRYTDAWGCTWEVTKRATMGEPTEPPLADEAKIAQYRPPFELLDRSRLARANRSCASTSRFVLAGTDTRPFDRLQWLRGTELACRDLGAGARQTRELLSTLHDFFCQEMEMWADTDVDGVKFTDNWGSPQGLLMDPQIWRDLFRPLYREYCEILQAKDKFVFFHSQGDISEIFGDLVDLGIDAINAELSLMDIEKLAEHFHGKVTFCGEIDRQHLLPGATREQIREAVLRVRRALDYGTGGVIARCGWETGVPMCNIAAIFEQWLVPLPMHA